MILEVVKIYKPINVYVIRQVHIDARNNHNRKETSVSQDKQ